LEGRPLIWEWPGKIITRWIKKTLEKGCGTLKEGWGVYRNQDNPLETTKTYAMGEHKKTPSKEKKMRIVGSGER